MVKRHKAGKTGNINIDPKVETELFIQPKVEKKKRAASIPKLRLDNPKFQNNCLKFLKALDPEECVAQRSLLNQLQNKGKKATFVEVFQLVQLYLDSKQYKEDKKNQ